MGLLACQNPSAPGVVLGLLVVVLTASVFVLLLFVDGNWDSWPQATCLASPLGCFCERDRGTLVRQPSNTFTNLAFTVVGAIVLLEAIQQQILAAASAVKVTPERRLGTAFACSYAVSQIILGAGSAWYHASLTFHGQWIDNAAMYLTVSAPLLYSRASLRLAARRAHGTTKGLERSAEVFVLEYTIVNIVLGALCFVVPSTRRYIFGVLIVGMLGYEIRARMVLPKRQKLARMRPLGAALLAFLVAFAVWTLDLRHIVCFPDSLLQGHALWHLLNGVATLNIYMYFHPIAHPPLPTRRV